MFALITGAAGQDGWFLADQLLARGWRVRSTSLAESDFAPDHRARDGELGRLDVTDAALVTSTLEELQPDVIFHLAGLSSVGGSWARPADYLTANAVGTCTLLAAVNQLRTSGINHPFIVNASSAEVFAEDAPLPFSETTPLNPLNPYGVSKVAAQFMLGTFRARGLLGSNAILFNHESHLRPATFVTGKIVQGVARIHAGLADELVLGNLAARRDWLHASDVAAAMIAIADRRAAQDFVVASGVSRTVGDFVAAAFASVGIANWQDFIRTDPALLRATDAPELRGDSSLLTATTGWRPQRQFEEWVGEMVERAPLDD